MKRHALFVGVNNYNDEDIRNLRYSIPDAAVLADRFKGLGYETRLLPDPTGAELSAAVLDSIKGLGRGDVFLFFFAGHGFTAQDGSHLLFCRDDIQKLLRVGNAGVKVDALEMLTGEGGFHRAFFLDSCRTDCFTGVENRGNEETRDLDFVKIPEPTDETGSYYLLRSCDKFRPSLEIKELGHGLFTQGLLDAIDARDRRLGGCNTDFATAVRIKMAERQKQYNVDISQRPSIGEFSGPVFSLFDDEFFSDIEKSDLSTMQSSPRVSTLPAVAIQTYVICPICGKKNKPEETFKCKRCGRDNICLWHQDKKTYLCTECSDETNQKAVHIEHKPNVENELYSILISYIPNSDTSAVMLCLQEKFGLTEKESASLIVKKGFVRRGVSKKEAESLASALRKSKWCIVDVVPGENSDTILDMYRNQAENGSAKAQFNLGVIYQSAKNLQEAIKWFLKAAEQGYAPAQHALVRYYTSCEKDLQKSADLLYKAAASGYAPAQYSLGLVFAKGQGGVTQDYTKAAYWFTEAAEQGYSDAIATLGMYYEGGDFGFPKDIKKATKYYTDAVKLGNKTAKERLENLNQMKIEGISKEDFESIKDLAQRLKKVDGDDYGLYRFTNKPVSDVIQRLNSIKKERVCFSKRPLYTINEKYTWDRNAMFRGFSVVKNEIYTLFVKSNAF